MRPRPPRAAQASLTAWSRSPKVGRDRLRSRSASAASIRAAASASCSAWRGAPGSSRRSAYSLTRRCDSMRQLAGAVHGVGVVGGGDHLARHLADAPVAVHGGGAQDRERLRLGHLAGPHQDALGAVDELALVEAAAQVGEVAAQPRLGGEAGAGDLDDGAQPLRRVAVDDVGVDARADGALDLGRVRVWVKTTTGRGSATARREGVEQRRRRARPRGRRPGRVRGRAASRTKASRATAPRT